MKYLLPFILILSTCSIATLKKPQPEFAGRWCGQVLVMDVEYIFTSESYVEITTYSGSQVGGTKGRIISYDSKIMTIEQTDEFGYGSWKASPKKYTMEYFPENDSLGLSPSYASDMVMILPRCNR